MPCSTLSNHLIATMEQIEEDLLTFSLLQQLHVSALEGLHSRSLIVHTFTSAVQCYAPLHQPYWRMLPFWATMSSAGLVSE